LAGDPFVDSPGGVEMEGKVFEDVEMEMGVEEEFLALL
jgi:hypothetical protein